MEGPTSPATAEPPVGPPAEPAASPPAVAPRPGLVTGAGITLIVLGIITSLVAVFLLIGASLFAGATGAIDTSDMPGMGGALGAFAGAIVVFVLIVGGWAALQLVSGFYVLAGREWARIVAIVVSIIGIVLALAGLGGRDSSSVLSIAFAAAQAFVVYVMFSERSWFTSDRAGEHPAAR